MKIYIYFSKIIYYNIRLIKLIIIIQLSDLFNKLVEFNRRKKDDRNEK